MIEGLVQLLTSQSISINSTGSITCTTING